MSYAGFSHLSSSVARGMLAHVAFPIVSFACKDYAALEKAINRKLRKVGPSYSIRNLYWTP